MVWTIMKMFGQVHVTEELNGSDIHRLENIITMHSDLHNYFDNLKLWLESTVRIMSSDYALDIYHSFSGRGQHI
jgi:hypothetical protein